MKNPPVKRLSPEDKIEVARLYWISLLTQHEIAARYGVNQGRINEVLSAIRSVIKGLR